jgi:hypothetical protein
MNDIDSPPSHQTTNRVSRGQAPASRRIAMHGDAGILRPACQKRIAERNQLGSVAAGEQSLQEQECLILSSTVLSAKVDKQRAHAQASPGFGHGRCVSFSPARSRPSLRYLK